jgi:HSF-type DNA-binding
MSMMKFAEKQDENYCVAWLEDGMSFVIRNPDEFTRSVVPKFFKPTKFSSFTRKLYRWGFRQVNRGIGPDDPIIFGNEYFQRDNLELMSKMRSITAAGTRKNEQASVAAPYALKRPIEDVNYETNLSKRILLDHYLQQSKNNSTLLSQCNVAPMPRTLDSFSLTNALGPQYPYGGFPNSGYLQLSRPSPYEMLPAARPMGGASLLNQYVAHGLTPRVASYPRAASTADIVNAAIAALRYAN